MPTTTTTRPIPPRRSTRPERALAAALIALATSFGSPARADDAAEAKHAQGTALTKSGNYEGARMKFLEALSMRPMSKTYLNLCVVEQHLGLEPEAVGHCKQFLAGDAAPAMKKTVEDGIYRELLAATGRLKIEAKAGDAIELDGLEVGKAPLGEPLVVKKGEHVIAAGGRSVRLTVKGGDTIAINLPLDGVDERAAVAHEAKLTIHTSKDATVYIDGKLVSTGGYAGTLKSGGHMVRVSAPGFEPFERELTLKDAENRELSVTLESKKGSVLPWVLVGAGVLAAAGATTAIVFAAQPGREEGVPKGSLPPGIVPTSIRF
jgi:hypothetical protein